MQNKRITEEELRELAEDACKESNGSGWDTMSTGDQEAQVASFIDGYRAGSDRPYFEIIGQGFGGSWEAGETIIIPPPQFVSPDQDADKVESYLLSVKESIDALFGIMGRKEGPLAKQINESFDELPKEQQLIMKNILFVGMRFIVTP